MVAVRDIHLKDNFTLEEWVGSLSLSDSDKDQLRTVYQYCLTLGDEALTSKLLVRGIEMVGILQMLSMDIGTLKAAIIYTFVEAGLIRQERMDEDFGSKIAQLVAETVMALIAEIIAKLLQLLWDLLNEECSVKQAMSVWKSIIKNMNAAGQVFDETGKAITLTQSNIIAAAKAKNHIEELAKQMEEKYSLENVKKEAGEWAAAEWKDITSIDDGFATGAKNGWKDATKGAYGRYVPADLQQMIKQTIDAKNAMSAKYEKLAGTKVKTPAVEKALASLKGLKEE